MKGSLVGVQVFGHLVLSGQGNRLIRSQRIEQEWLWGVLCPQIGLPCSDGTLAMTVFDFYRTLLLELEREKSQTTNPRSSWLCLILPQRLHLMPCSAY